MGSRSLSPSVWQVSGRVQFSLSEQFVHSYQARRPNTALQPDPRRPALDKIGRILTLNARPLGRTQPVTEARSLTCSVAPAARAPSRTSERINRGANGRGARRDLLNRGGTRTHTSVGGMRRGLGNAGCRAPAMQTNAGGACLVGWATSCGQARLSVLTSHAPTGACS